MKYQILKPHIKSFITEFVNQKEAEELIKSLKKDNNELNIYYDMPVTETLNNFNQADKQIEPSLLGVEAQGNLDT